MGSSAFIEAKRLWVPAFLRDAKLIETLIGQGETIHIITVDCRFGGEVLLSSESSSRRSCRRFSDLPPEYRPLRSPDAICRRRLTMKCEDCRRRLLGFSSP